MVPTDTDLSQGSSTEQNNKYDTKREVVAFVATTSLRIPNRYVIVLIEVTVLTDQLIEDASIAHDRGLSAIRLLVELMLDI